MAMTANYMFDDKKPHSYFHIQACGPGGIADADGGFAARILSFIIKKASTKPWGSLVFPTDWTTENWNKGEVVVKGAVPYSVEAHERFRSIGKEQPEAQ